MRVTVVGELREHRDVFTAAPDFLFSASDTKPPEIMTRFGPATAGEVDCRVEPGNDNKRKMSWPGEDPAIHAGRATAIRSAADVAIENARHQGSALFRLLD